MAADARPVIFLAFANEQEDSANYLRNLPEERRRLLAVLDREAAPYTVAQYPNLTIAELVAGLQRYNHRIVLFHYGGHSDNSYLLLESAVSKSEFAHAGGLAKLLAQQHGLHLVFLNGCFNRKQADLLLDAGVPIVVATNSEIEDDAALEFASCFYEALAGNATVRAAFDLAAGAVELQKGQLAAQDLPWELCCRDQSAAEWRLADAVGDPCWGLPPLPRRMLPERPFRGLAWYRREDADLFFGRCAEIRDLLERVMNEQGAPILLLYGQSGVGKSSLLDAGLIPRLEGTAHCIYLRHSKSEGFVPALRRALGAPGAVQSVRDAWIACAAGHGSPVVVILDQVEMLFVQPNAQAQSSAELDDLLLAMQSLFGSTVAERPRGKLVLGFRKEYLAEIETTLVGRTLPHAKVFVEPLSRRGVIEAVMGIARTPHLRQQYGLTVSGGLADQIADDLLEDTESPLAPTLQVLLTKLWEQAEARSRAQPTFDEALYRQVKREGLALADFLTRQLEAVQAQNPTASSSGLVLDLLHFCTTPTPGAAQRTSAELQQMYHNHPPDAFSALLQQCKSAYLLVDGAEDRAADISIRLAHDAIAPLVRERFARSDAPGQRARRTLENRAVEWQNGATGALFDDRDLVLVEQGESGMRARSPDEERLLRSSQAARRHRRRIRVGLSLAALLVLFFFLIYAGVVALRDQAQEDDIARQESQWLADLSLQQLLVDPAISATLAWRALPSPAQPKPYVPRAEFALTQALRSGLQRQLLQVARPPVTNEQVALGAEYFAVGGDALRLLSFDLAQVITLTTGAPAAYVVAWDSAGQQLLSRTGNTVEIWREGKRVGSQQFRAPIACAAWRPNSDQIVVCSGDALRLWDNAAQTLTNVADFDGQVLSAQWSPGGERLVAWAAAADGNHPQAVLVWDAARGQQLLAHRDETPRRVRATVWSPNGEHLLVVHDDAAMLLWNAADASQSALYNRNRLDGAAFVDDSRFLTWGVQDGVRLWSVDSTAPLRQYGSAADLVQEVQLSPDRQRALLFLQSGQVDDYDLTTSERTATRSGHTKRVQAAAWFDNYLATASLDGTVRVWAARAEGPAWLTLYGHQAAVPGRADVLGAHWSPDGSLLTYGIDGTFRVWDVLDEDGQPLCRGSDPDGYPRCVRYSGALEDQPGQIVSARWLSDDAILTVDGESTARRISVANGEIQKVANDSTSYPDVLWSPDGRQVFSYTPSSYLVDGDSADGVVSDAASSTQAMTIPGPISYASWLQEGIIVSRDNGSVQIINPETGAPTAIAPETPITVTAVASNAAGILALGDAAGTVHLWDMKTSNAITTFAMQKPGELPWPVHELQWSADGRLLLASSNNVVLWNHVGGTMQWTTAASSLENIHAALSPKGDYVALASDNGFSVLDAGAGAVLWENKAAHDDTVNGVAWLVGDTWPNQDRYGPVLGRVADWISGVQRPRDRERLLLMTWSGDGTTKLWDWREHAEIMRLAQPAGVIQAAVSRDGRQILTAGISESGESTNLRVWQAWRHVANLPLESFDNKE